MKAVILAAGIGSRLRPLTNAFPKCMIEVNKIKIIEKQLKNLINNGIKEILIITGYKSEKIKVYLKDEYLNINIIENKDYLITNNMYSLYLAKKFLKGEDFILMNADVFFEEKIVKILLEDQRKNLIVCDKGKYIEESMKIQIEKEEKNIIAINKTISLKKAYGTTIDVYKFSEKAGKKLFEIIDEFIERKKQINLWTEVAIQELFKYEKIYSKDINLKWVEIDNLDDLKQAENLFKGDEC